jgi:integrase
MASIARDKNGNRRILFVAPDGKRPTIRLGKVSQRAAEAVKFRVEQLLAAKLTGHAIEADTAGWVANLEPAMAKKLAAVGLILKPEAKAAETLQGFINQYVGGQSDIKARTAVRLEQAGRKLVEHFGADRQLPSFTTGDADGFRLWLVGQGLAENTVRRLCGRAKQFFRAAQRRKLVTDNPFADLVSAVRGNPSRLYFVTRDDAAKVLDACPDAEWRLLFALARFGGVRTPSESLALKWGDIDWEHDRIRVPSPKTEHIEGKELRLIPMFPELLPHLEAAFDEAQPGTEYVITRYRGGNVNLRTQLERIIRRAGVTPWGKPWQNLRSTRETELMEEYPAHVVCAWIGNSESVARKHYLQLTDEHFARAVQGGPSKAAQKAAQQAHAEDRSEPHEQQPAHEKAPDLPGPATSCEYLPIRTVPPRGVEPRFSG